MEWASRESSQDIPRSSSDTVLIDDSDDSDGSYFPPLHPPRRPHEGSTGSAILETLPLLRRPSIYIDRTKTGVSLGPGRGPSYGSEDDGGQSDDGAPLVRVQSGVKKVEAITLLWTKKSLIIAYVR